MVAEYLIGSQSLSLSIKSPGGRVLVPNVKTSLLVSEVMMMIYSLRSQSLGHVRSFLPN